MEKKEIKFQDQDFEENFHVGQSKAKVKTKEQQNQTDKIQLRHIRLQVKGHHDIETQTQEEKMKTPRVSDEDVLEFLQKVTPMVQKALTQNLQSRTFKNLSVTQNVLETAKQISVIQQCQTPVSAVAWNCTGSIICMAFSEEEHEG